MSCCRWLGVVAMVAFTLVVSVNAQDSKFEEIDAKGQPKNLKAGLSARYAIWYDKTGWHLRVTTSAGLTAFTGIIEPVDGKITSVKLLPNTTLKTETGSFKVNLKVGGKGIINGMDLQLADTATALKFTLKVDDKEAPYQIYIGSQGKHPKGATFYLPAKPGK